MEEKIVRTGRQKTCCKKLIKVSNYMEMTKEK